MNIQCDCKKGYKSAWDGKCGNCRTKEETRRHNYAMNCISSYDIQILNKYKDDITGAHYIGRGSPLGNPHAIGQGFKRGEAIYAYDNYIHDVIERVKTAKIIDELNKLVNELFDKQELKLWCFCAPKPCHGDVIKDLLLKQLYKHFAGEYK